MGAALQFTVAFQERKRTGGPGAAFHMGEKRVLSEIINDLIFSINTVLPVFIVVLVGYVMRKRGTVDEHFVGSISNVVFYYALPARMFLDVATSDFMELMNLRFILVTVVGTIGVFLAAWLVISHCFHDGRIIAAAVHSAYRGNYIYIGLPIIQNILQTDYVACSVLILTFVLPVYNILGVLILSWYSGDMSKLKPGKLLLDILKNPMILAVIFGVLYGLTGLPMPYAAEKSLTYLGAIATPMALLMIGARMVGNSIKGEEKVIRLTMLFKLVLGPLIMTLVAIYLGMPREEIVSVFVLFAVPTAMNVFIMTKSMGGDDGLAANAILTSVPGSVVAMTVGIYLMRIAGIV